MKKIFPEEIIESHDAQAVNFREIRMGNIAPKTLYRSSHPIKDNKQETMVSLLASGARIAAVLNLCDTEPEIYKKAFFAPWYNKLLGSNRVIALGMDFDHTSAAFRKKLKNGLRFIIDTTGPWLIHCQAGVDRTGFFSMALEALMSATIDEITNDYLQSFNSIFDSSIHKEVNKSDSLVVMKLLSVMSSNIAITDENIQAIAEKYLRDTIRLSAKDLDLLKNKLAGRVSA